jgi:hypothetical protein
MFIRWGLKQPPVIQITDGEILIFPKRSQCAPDSPGTPGSD